MILLSLIVGLGLAEILSGIGNSLRRNGTLGFRWTHGALTLTVFFGLLQTFWESWGLRAVETWSFPAMLLMLGSPILLYLIAHMLFPDREDVENLDDYYFARASLLWPLAGLTVIVGTLFRPVVFGQPLWAIDNASAVPILAVCVLLSITKRRLVHRILIPVVLLSVLLDTITFSHSIG